MTTSSHPRAIRRVIGLAVWIAGFGFVATAALAGDRVDVYLDQARVLTMPANVKTMILGNPGIADVTLLKKGAMVITGKSFGETNLIALDSDGKLVVESTIRVSAAGGKLVVQRGMVRESYICNPRCEATVSLGDDSRFMGQMISNVGARDGFAQPSRR